jgi:hypothetical protein
MGSVRRPTAQREVRAEALWMAAAAATVLIGLAGLLLQNGRYYWNGDTPAAYYGWWYHLGDLVRHGHWGTLDPHAWKAGNLAAEGQWALWNPLIIGIGLLTTVVQQTLVLTTIVKLVVAVGGALGVFRLARSYGAALAASYVAAVAAPMGGMTQYLDLPSWWAAQLIWALVPWVWWAVRRVSVRGANPLAALVLGYLLVTVGYVYGTIMLIVVLVACLVDARIARERASLLRVLGIGALLGLVAVTVYLPGVLTASVTARSEGLYFGGKFSTDPLALFASVLPTAAVPGTSDHLEPYAYLVWFLPAVVWIDWRRLRAGWRPLAGLWFMFLVTLAVVDGLGQLGPLRWPLRLQPFLVEALVVVLAVTWTRFGLRRPSPRRLALALAWVALAGILSVVRADSMWRSHLVSVAVVAAGLVVLWWLVRAGRPAGAALAAGLLTLVVLAVQHAAYPTLPSPNRYASTDLAAYRTPLAGAVGDVMQVGASDTLLQTDPPGDDLLLGSGWYLNPHRVQGTYTTINFLAYKNLYCAYYQGDTCAGALSTLLSVEPTTGLRRVDLLGVSTLMLIKRDFPPSRLEHPPSGWRVAARTTNTVLWVRRQALPGAGAVAWSSPGTQVTDVEVADSGTSFKVTGVPATGGTVVLSLLDWPGYRTDVGSLSDPVDGYLVTVHLPPGSTGDVVHVDFRPPGWPLELGAWAFALVVGAAWSILTALRRRRTADVSS